MNELLAKLLAKLGIELTAGAEPTPEQGVAALSALDALAADKTQATELAQQLAALKAQAPAGQVDLAQFVPKATYDALVTQVAALSAQVETTDAASVLKQAREQGKVVAAEEDYLRQFAAQKGVAALQALLAPRPAIAALSAQQTTQLPPPAGKPGLAVLSAEDKYAADQLGISHADFAKLKESN